MYFRNKVLSMELSKNYVPNETEARWYQHWLSKGYFKSTPDEREAYTIVMPPPNVTGVLHMGHCLNNTIQDILIRRARMQGKMLAGYPEQTMLLLLQKLKWWPCLESVVLPNQVYRETNF